MRILVVRNDKLGDFVMALPTFYVLKNYNPQNKIIACVAPVNKSLALSMPFIDEVIVDDTDSSFALSKKIKEANIDASITLFSNTKVAFAQFLAGIKTRIAPATKIAQIFYTKRITQRRSRVEKTEIEYNLDLVNTLFKDCDLNYPSPLLHVENKQKIEDDFREEFNIPKDKKIIAFHPGFGGTAESNWSLDEYLNLANEIVENTNYQIVFTFGPGEYDLLELAKKSAHKDIILYKSVGSPMDFANLLSTFSLFISISTGASHLASMVGVKTITFFAGKFGSSSDRWAGISTPNLQTNLVVPIDKEEKQQTFKKLQIEFSNLIKTLLSSEHK